MTTESTDPRSADGRDLEERCRVGAICNPGFEAQLVMLDIEDFWTMRSLDELAAAQGVGIVESVEMLQDDTISDEEAEAFLAAIGL
ncbi:MAG: hypothetical protein OXC06_18525 [Acidimicrobiaceae bacterium]|nr:hypothetical protein [Acidimicrobiaceae bacterium]